jgi:hypothetical protein
MSSQSNSAPQSGASEKKPDLDQLYKPVGIQAITAAAMCRGPGNKSK